MSELTENIGKRIKAYRKEHKLSQEDLSNKAKISSTYLGQIERAEKTLSIDILNNIATAIGISLTEFFDFDNDSVNKSSGTINRINAQLKFMTEEELREILKIIKLIRNFKEL